MVNILSPSGIEDPIGGEPHSRAMISRNWGRINDNWKPLEGAISITLGAAWESRGSGFRVPQVYKIGERIYLQGSISNKNVSTYTAGVEYVLGTITDANYQIPVGKAGDFTLQFRATTSYAVFPGTITVSQVAGTTSLRMYPSATVTNLGAQLGSISLDEISWLEI